ncbi:MAG: hypothetical protein RLY23_354 [Actinomycetota bacterium]
MVLRRTHLPIVIRDTHIDAGARVFLLIGSANRDEDVFDSADIYDLDRPNGDLMSFGNGRHFCLGALLARHEARIALDELVKHVSDYEIDEALMARVHSANVRGFATLPTTVKVR